MPKQQVTNYAFNTSVQLDMPAGHGDFQRGGLSAES